MGAHDTQIEMLGEIGEDVNETDALDDPKVTDAMVSCTDARHMRSALHAGRPVV